MKEKSLTIALLLSLTFLWSCQGEKKNIQTSQTENSTGDIPIRWANNKLPLNLKISEYYDLSFTGGDHDSNGFDPFEQMMKQWNQSHSSVDFFRIAAAATTNKSDTNLTAYQDSELGIYASTAWFSEVSSSALAITQFFGSRKNVGSSDEFLELIHADIIVNERDFSFSLNSADTTAYDLPSVILHELGHFLGLGHQSNLSIPSVMHPFLSKSDAKRTLESGDISTINSTYNRTINTLTAVSGQLMALTEDGGATYGRDDDAPLERGVIELHTDGSCKHYLNGKLVRTHESGLVLRK